MTTLHTIQLDLESEMLAAASTYLTGELARDVSKRVKDRGVQLAASGLVSATLSGEDVRAQVEDQGETHKVRMALPIYDGGVSYAECSCFLRSHRQTSPYCAHIWATHLSLVHALTQRLAREAAPMDHWEGVFAAMDTFTDEAAAAAPSSQMESHHTESRLWWRIDDELTIWPYQQQRAEDGTWQSGRRLSWAEFLDNSRWRNHVDQLAAARVKPKRLSARDDAFDLDTFGLLQDLAGHDLLSWAKPHLPLAITVGKIGLAAKTSDTGIVVSSHINGLLPDKQWIFSGRGYVTRAGSPPQLFIATANQATTDFLSKLAENAHAVPLAHKERLLSYLVRMEQHLAVAVADTLVPHATAAASDKTYLRLTPLQPKGLKLEMLVRPSPTGGYFPLGAGPETVLDLSDTQQARNVRRDFIAEQSKGLALVQSLGLETYRCYHGHMWFIAQDDEALDIISALENMAAKDSSVLVEWPKYAQRAYEQEEALAGQSLKLSIGEGRDWFNVEGHVTVGTQSVELQELMEAIKRKLRYIQLKNGKWTRVTELFAKRLGQLSHLLEEQDGQVAISPAAIPALAAWDPGKEELEITSANQQWFRAYRCYAQAKKIAYPLPQPFTASLRPYQMTGYQWLCELAEAGMGACLADDMGLGKTIQTLAVLSHLASRGPSLVVTPTSVSPNWVKEAKRFAPGLRPIMYRDTDRSATNFQAGDLVIVSYGLVQRDADLLARVPWNTLVLDEAQFIKNFHTKTAQAIHQLPAQWRLALSGTPIENTLSELWSLFRVVSPGMLGTWERFKRSYALPIERFRLESARQRLEQRLRPFILRRMKEDYLHELPPKTEIDISIELSDDERMLYDAVRLSSLRSLAEKAQRAADKGEDADPRLAILAALTKLRQIACHPRLYDANWAAPSAKLLAFVETCQNLRANGHKALVFSQFTSHLHILGEALKSLGIPYLYLDGATPPRQRAALVEAFQAGEADFFLISIKAGGTGLSLTAANYVLHMDPWWNPAVEDQATDRAHRMGQTKPLTIYRFVARDTVEEKIMQLHASKRELVESLFAANTLPQGAAMPVAQLMDLLQSQAGRDQALAQTPKGKPLRP